MEEKTYQLAAILMAFSVIASTETHAEIYKHVDQNGRITYSNKAVSGASKLPANSPFSTKNRNQLKPTNSYPIVSNDAQAKRDQKRRQILENELAIEKKLFVNAKQNLINTQKNAKVLKINSNNTQKNLTENSKDFKSRKSLHERNITALRKELAN